MDPVSEFLSGLRASRAFALLIEMSPPWGIEVEDEAALTVIAVTRGALSADGVVLEQGDVALITGPRPYRLADPAGAAVTARILAGQRCVSPTGESLRYEFRRGVHRWGNSASGETAFVVGSYERGGEVAPMVTRALPPLAVIRRGDADQALIGLLQREVVTAEIAHQVMIDRLLDLLVVSVIRATLGARGPWPTSDPLVVQALARLHEHPAEAWTVEGLARSLHVSRAALASRFRAGVGTSPIAYLTGWRLTLASEYLADVDAPIADIARRVGYANAFAFSTAFKRRFGASPRDYRSRLATAAVT